MIYRVFVFKICLSCFFIFTTMSYLCGMDSCGTEGKTDRVLSKFYTNKDSELIYLVLGKIKDIVFVLKDAEQEPIKKIGLSTVPEKIRIFYPPQEKEPSIVFGTYLNRFVKYLPQAPFCYVAIIIYINRLIDKYGPNIFNQFSSYRIFLAAFVIAAKCFDDVFYSDDFYSDVGGVSSEYLRDLQMQFLKILDFNIFISKEEFDNFLLNAPEVFLFCLGLNIKVDDFLAGLNRELDDFICEFKKMKLGDMI